MEFLLNVFEDPRDGRSIGQVQLRNQAPRTSVDDTANFTIEVPDSRAGIALLAEKLPPRPIMTRC